MTMNETAQTQIKSNSGEQSAKKVTFYLIPWLIHSLLIWWIEWQWWYEWHRLRLSVRAWHNNKCWANIVTLVVVVAWIVKHWNFFFVTAKKIRNARPRHPFNLTKRANRETGRVPRFRTKLTSISFSPTMPESSCFHNCFLWPLSPSGKVSVEPFLLCMHV